MSRRILTGIITVCMLISLTLSTAFSAGALQNDYWTDYAADSFSGGSGAAGDPYLIGSAEELARLASISRDSDLSGTHYALTADIDLSAHQWVPIRFFGMEYGDEESITLDGRGHTIRGLSVRQIDCWTEEYADNEYTYRWRCVGLFSALEYSSIRNLTLGSPVVEVECSDSAMDYNYDYYVGALAGYSTQSIIENCVITNPEVRLSCLGAGDSWCYVGGMVGICESDVMLMNCAVSGGSVGSVSQTEYTYLFIGGLAGRAGGYCFICNSSSGAKLDVGITSNPHQGTRQEDDHSSLCAGGLVGDAMGAMVYNSYSAAYLSINIEASDIFRFIADIGGIMGDCTGELRNSYFCGDIALDENLGPEDYLGIGKTIGWYGSSNGIGNNYYHPGTSGNPYWWDITTDTTFVDETNAYKATIPISSLEGTDEKTALCLALNSFLYDMQDTIYFGATPHTTYWIEELRDVPGFPHTSSWKIVPGVNDGYPVFCEENEWPFEDVQRGDWFFEPVRHVYMRWIVNGVTDSLFAPGEVLTRATLITMLWRMEAEPEPGGEAAFADVPAGAWYSKAVSWAYESKIVTGVGNGLFAPFDMLTREQMAAIFFRYARLKDYIVADKYYQLYHGYKDIDDISDWALSPMAWCNDFGLINGTTHELLSPKNGSTRAEAATIILRLYKYLYDWRNHIPAIVNRQ